MLILSKWNTSKASALEWNTDFFFFCYDAKNDLCVPKETLTAEERQVTPLSFMALESIIQQLWEYVTGAFAFWLYLFFFL